MAERGVPLGTMGVAQVLESGVRIYRRHAGTLAAAAAVVTLPYYALLATVILFTARPETITAGGATVEVVQTPPWLGLANNVILYLVVYPVLTAVMTRVALDAVRGAGTSFREAYRSVAAWVPWLLAAQLLAGIVTFAPWIAALRLGAAAGPRAALALILAVIPVVIFLAIRFLFVPPVVVVERGRPLHALRRAWRLVRGLGWKALGATLLALLVVSLFLLVVSLLFILPVAAGGGGVTRANLALLTAGTGVGATLAIPFFNLVVILLYLDARARKEDVGPEHLEQDLEER